MVRRREKYRYYIYNYIIDTRADAGCDIPLSKGRVVMTIKIKIVAGCLVPLVLLLAVGLAGMKSTKKMSETNEWVDHTHNVMAEAKRVLGSAVDMETGMRGYLLAGDEAFLEPYRDGGERFDLLIDRLRRTVSDNPSQVALLDEIRANIHAWRDDVVGPAIELRRTIGDAQTMDHMADLVGEARGKTYFDLFREQIATFISREQELMERRRRILDDAFVARDAARLDDLEDSVRRVKHTHEVIADANRVLASAVDMETGMRGYLLAGREEFLEPYHGGKDRFEDLVAGLKETVGDNPPQVTLLGEIERTIREWQADVVEPKVEMRRQIGDAPTMNDMASLVAEARGKTYFDRFRDQIALFIEREQELMDVRQAESQGAEGSARTLILITSGAAAAISLCLIYLLMRGIVRPLGMLTERIKDIAEGEGDLTQRVEVKSRDEIGKLGVWFNAFIAKIHDVIAEVKDSSAEVAATSTQIASSVEEIAAGMSEQSERITTASASVEQMSASANEVARKSADAAKSASESGRLATEGGETVTGTVAGMRSINAAVSSSATSVLELGKRGEQIGEVITVINDIADQTNLLALNAAIEAARAGEHGRGFAVVAEEVRKLADRTTTATQGISVSIQAIQDETSLAVENMNAGTEKVVSGVEEAESAGEALEQIVASAQEVSAMVQSIASAADQQSVASRDVGKDIEQISSVTHQTTEGANQAASAANQLSQRAEKLRCLVGHFKVGSARAV